MANRIYGNAYTVNLIFNSDGSQVLLQLKDRSKFKGTYNGIGGKLNYGEGPKPCAVREIKEESNIEVSCHDIKWLGTLNLPYDCAEHCKEDDMCTLYWYGCVISDMNISKPDDATELLEWFNVQDVINHKCNVKFAGNGNLEYFVNLGYIMLFKNSNFYE